MKTSPFTVQNIDGEICLFYFEANLGAVLQNYYGGTTTEKRYAGQPVFWIRYNEYVLIELVDLNAKLWNDCLKLIATGATTKSITEGVEV